jgi:hypothetical protein
MHPHDLVKRHSEKPERIVVPKVVFNRKGQFGQIGKCLDVIRLHPGCIHLAPIRFNSAIYPGDQML